MTGTLALLAYAVAVGTGGAAMLRRCAWPLRAPRLGVVAWQALSASIVLALLLAGLTIIVPLRVIATTSPAEVLDACLAALRAQYATPVGAALHIIGAAATLGIAAKIGYLLIKGLRDARAQRLEHLTRLRMVARRDCALDALIVQHPTAAAYCLPGRARTVVLTSAAVAALDEDELAAVLAHERAHLRGRHHLVRAVAEALTAALPLLPGLRWARSEQARLLEMIADDDAATGVDRITVARALVNLAEGSTPAVAFGAADVAALSRVRRLVQPADGLGLLGRTAVAGALALTVVAPIAIAASPTWAATHSEFCPVPGMYQSS